MSPKDEMFLDVLVTSSMKGSNHFKNPEDETQEASIVPATVEPVPFVERSTEPNIDNQDSEAIMLAKKNTDHTPDAEKESQERILAKKEKKEDNEKNEEEKKEEGEPASMEDEDTNGKDGQTCPMEVEEEEEEKEKEPARPKEDDIDNRDKHACPMVEEEEKKEEEECVELQDEQTCPMKEEEKKEEESTQKEEEDIEKQGKQTCTMNLPGNDKVEDANKEAESVKTSWGNRFKSLRRHFVNRSGSASVTNSTAMTPVAQQQKVTETESDDDKKDYESFRAATVSVTVVKSTVATPMGISLKKMVEEEEGDYFQQQQQQQCNMKPDIIQISEIYKDHGLLCCAPLQVGDVVKTVNNQKATNLEETRKQLQELEGAMTLTVETPHGNPCLVQAMVTKPTANSTVGIGFFNVQRPNGTSLLEINHLSPRGLLAHSALSQGYLVLAINGTPCSHFKAEDAAKLVKQSEEHVTIVAMKPNIWAGTSAYRGAENRARSFLRGAKRAGVAVGGGAMVGVGLVFIPTLPPPFGEVLMVGGVSLLGTEFEAPKRVMKNARDSFARALGEDDEQENREAGVAPEDAPTVKHSNTFIKKKMTHCDSAISEISGESSMAEDEEEEVKSTVAVQGDECSESDLGRDGVPFPSKRTTKHRLKRFGRNVILPFLDQIVGDKQATSENEAKEKTASVISSDEIKED